MSGFQPLLPNHARNSKMARADSRPSLRFNRIIWIYDLLQFHKIASGPWGLHPVENRHDTRRNVVRIADACCVRKRCRTTQFWLTLFNLKNLHSSLHIVKMVVILHQKRATMMRLSLWPKSEASLKWFILLTAQGYNEEEIIAKIQVADAPSV